MIKTIKTRIYRYFTFKQSYRYIDKLQSFAEGYNHTNHGTIDMEPAKVSKGNEELVRLSTYFTKPNDNEGVRKITFKFEIGDKVRITQLRNIFSREYDEKLTEVFNISSRLRRSNTPIYPIKDYNGEEITGTFYQSELQKIDIKDDELWKIEKILKTKGKGHNKQLYIKWLNWPHKFDSWISSEDIEDY